MKFAVAGVIVLLGLISFSVAEEVDTAEVCKNLKNVLKRIDETIDDTASNLFVPRYILRIARLLIRSQERACQNPSSLGFGFIGTLCGTVGGLLGSLGFYANSLVPLFNDINELQNSLLCNTLLE